MKAIAKAAIGALALATAAVGAIAPADAARIVTTTRVVTIHHPVVVVHRHNFFRRAWVRHAWLRHERHMMMRQAFLTRR